MIRGDFFFALAAGMVVTVNPCGFAMLPAYLSSFLGLAGPVDERANDRPASAAVARALLVSSAVTLGFVSVFLVLGTLARVGANAVYSISKWLTIVIGIGLVILGIAMIFGYKPPILTPKLDKGGRSKSFGSMGLFGISYAVASLGCSLAPFLTVVFAGGKRNGILSGIVSFLAYGLGFAVVLTALTVSLAMARGGFLRKLRSTMQFIDRISAVLLVLAGLYITWYGIIEVRGSKLGNVVGKGDAWSGQVRSFVQDHQTTVLIVAATIIGAGAAGVFLARRKPSSTT
jgi:cytochrome c biogenesis protein CcdA